MNPRAVARLLAALFLFLVVPANSPAGATAWVAAREFNKRFTPFVATPYSVVEKMLELAGVGRNDTVYDLGSGDGRIVIAAAKDFGARAVGVEIRSELWKQSSEEIARLGIEKRARIIHDDMFQVNVAAATVVTLYQLTAVNDRLRPLLEKGLRPGARVVSVDFEIPDWTPTKTLRVKSENGNEYKLFLYVRP
jgi:protein-L-isoaspartate O-methyltransferase